MIAAAISAPMFGRIGARQQAAGVRALAAGTANVRLLAKPGMPIWQRRVKGENDPSGQVSRHHRRRRT
jgi:hypothetical protein